MQYAVTLSVRSVSWYFYVGSHYNGFLRSGEFIRLISNFDASCGLALGDISFTSGGQSTPGISILLKASKTDPFCSGTIINIFLTGGITCPINALNRFITLRDSFSVDPGPLFLLTFGHPLSRALDPKSYHGHSFRIGVATTAAKLNVPDYLIQQLGCWTSNCYQVYIWTDDETLKNTHLLMARGCSPSNMDEHPLVPSPLDFLLIWSLYSSQIILAAIFCSVAYRLIRTAMTTGVFSAWTGRLPQVSHLILVYVYIVVIWSGGRSQHGQGYFLHCVKNVALISHLLIMFLSVSLVEPHRLHLAWTGGLHQSSTTGFISLGRRLSIFSAPQASVSLDRRHPSVQPLRLQSAWTGGINQISPTGFSQPGQ